MSGGTRSLDDFVRELIGTDVHAPALKAQLASMVAPTFEVVSGEKSGIAFLVENSGVDERSIIDVLMALQDLPLPEPVADRLQEVGFDRSDLVKLDIGTRRVAAALVQQHIGLLSRNDQAPSEPEASS